MKSKSDKSGYSIRWPNELRDSLIELAKQKSENAGRDIPLSEVVLECIEYGKEVVSRENSHQIVMPKNVRTKTEQLAYVAKYLIDVGMDNHFGGPLSPVSIPGPDCVEIPEQ